MSTEKKKEYFTSRLGFILSLMGVAIGAGNIWRFSRIAAQNGGGSFIIPWVIFLFIWSIPLLIAEIALGKFTRKGPIGALAIIGGKKIGWMGAFIALVATGILFYYSVVVGWGFSYFFYSITGKMVPSTDFKALWESYTHSYIPLFFHALSITIGSFVVYKGIVKGIERSNKILMPLLFAIVLILLVRALTLPNAIQGVSFLFTPHFEDLLNYKVWIEALTQNAWDTGAGWGLVLVYACFAHKNESVTVNGCITAFSNNAVSLLFGMIIFSTVLALDSQAGLQALITGEGASQTGITFIYLPKLFVSLPGGAFIQSTFAAIFFIAFSCAALSSMISMVQLTSQVLYELGLSKNVAVLITGAVAFLCGIPSSLNINFFNNQDWVWGLGLLVSGLFIAYAIIRYGVDKFRNQAINTSPHDFKLGKWYNFFIKYLIPVQALLLIGWYFFVSLREFDIQEWWSAYSILTLLLQWGAAISLFIILNNWLVKKSLSRFK